MSLLALILSRFVPLLLLLSACLALGRFLFDRLNSRSHLVATSVFGGFIALGPLLAVPHANRLRLRIAAEQAFSDHRWEDADRAFSRYRELGGRESDAMLFHSGVSLMNLGQWSEAERVLSSAARRDARGPALPPPMAIQIGICRYFEGRFPE